MPSIRKSVSHAFSLFSLSHKKLLFDFFKISLLDGFLFFVTVLLFLFFFEISDLSSIQSLVHSFSSAEFLILISIVSFCYIFLYNLIRCSYWSFYDAYLNKRKIKFFLVLIANSFSALKLSLLLILIFTIFILGFFALFSQSLFGFFFFIISLIFCVIFLLLTTFIYPELVLNKKGIIDSIGTSAYILKNNFVKSFGLLIVVGLISLILTVTQESVSAIFEFLPDTLFITISSIVFTIFNFLDMIIYIGSFYHFWKSTYSSQK